MRISKSMRQAPRLLYNRRQTHSARRRGGQDFSPAVVAAACDGIRKDVHQVQPAVISITNATEYGLVYRASEVAALGELAQSRGLHFHMDGARFANALASTGENIADVTWRAGLDALSFGFVKNGGLNAEVMILFKADLADEVAVRRKRAGHLLSKGRFLAAQVLAMLENDLWLENARAANAAARTVATAAPDRLVYPVEANEIFLKATNEEAARLRGQGFDFYDWAPGEIRLVTSWDQEGRVSTVWRKRLRRVSPISSLYHAVRAIDWRGAAGILQVEQ